MRNIKLVIEYDGTNYHGWQSQIGTGRPTIQDSIELAIAMVAAEDVTTYSSGRTDAGVHAWGHVANFRTRSSIPAEAWTPALNHVLPPDIRVVSSVEAGEDFHARFSALRKTYVYRILNRQAPSAIHRHLVWHVNRIMDVGRMRQAAVCLLGKHDFSAFRGSGCSARTTVRTMSSVAIHREGDFVELRMEADAFLMHMARNIVGTLVEVGLGRFQVEDVAMMLASRDRTRSGRTAPPQGLYLETVRYTE
jgi:tRNA pseudouridine38-40 synthase